MEKNFKQWTMKIEKAGEDGRYAKVVARTTTAALNWVCKNCECELDDIVWMTNEPIDVAAEE